MAHRIRNSLISGCPEPAHSHQHCQSSAWLFFSFIIGFGIAFILNIPIKFIEHHLFGRVLKQEKKTAQKLARPVSLVLSICFCDLYNRDRYAGSSTGTGGNIRKHSEKDRRKYSGFPEMDRQCIRKQSGSCEIGRSLLTLSRKNNRFCTRRTEERSQ